MTIFSANTADLSQAGRTISNLGENYKSNITSIFSVIDNLQSHWSGGASTQYMTAFNSHRTDLNNLGSAIENMGRALQNAANAFEDNETDLAGKASRL